MSIFIKKPNQLEEYTADMALELRRCSQDPVHFISNYCYIQNQEEGKMLFKLRPYQVRIIKAYHKHQFNILLQGRQSGKTEVTAAFAYWFAIFHDNKNVLIASNKQKGATDIMNRIRFMYESTPNFLRPGANFYNRGSIEFDNGSKVWSEATTPDTGRGKSVALLIVDELAHVRKKIQEAMWVSVGPTISSGKLNCIIMSTPNGDVDLFAELWRGAQADNNDFHPEYVDIKEVPGRDEKWQKAMISKFGETSFRQEFLAEFISSDPLLINSLVLQRIQPVTPLFEEKGFFFWKQISPAKTYIISSDVAEGVQQDYSTIQVIELDTLEQVAEYRSNKVKENQLYNAIKWIVGKILTYRDPRTNKKPTVYWSFENNSAGAAIGSLYYADEKFPPEAQLLNGKGERLGFRTVNRPKVEACRHLKNLIEKSKGGLKINSKLLLFELKNYIASGASYAAKPGATDDLISAMLIGMRMIKQLSEYEPDVFEKLYHNEGEFYDEVSNEYDTEPMPFLVG